ncbi:hypothetical protein Slala03_61740 [Streptomyces lavendulae subsp. lavendulae]|uniref:hypothetical protein n=1 Tax=Streptomyces lavendulae TaxID=1914 RepID=UPI0024A51E67|nr:hypothetical protein [Streptomyces lavendulae]GLV86485.1 hypothetical protein Slala03_61740 [Streptomyces lavendulae subsp. lavendulae]
MPYEVLTDRDERALLLRAENRISRPLRIGAALAAVGAFLARRPRGAEEERESLPCQQKRKQSRTPAAAPVAAPTVPQPR